MTCLRATTRSAPGRRKRRPSQPIAGDHNAASGGSRTKEELRLLGYVRALKMGLVSRPFKKKLGDLWVTYS